MSEPICPECVQGKCGNCDGTAWNDAADDLDRYRPPTTTDAGET